MSWLVQEVAERGFALVDDAALVSACAEDPWLVADHLFGARSIMVERQLLCPRPRGRSFAAGCGAAPLHTDSQLYGGLPADWQVLACVRPAADGGATLLADGWDLLCALEARDPPLFAAAFDIVRHIRFVFGDVFAPVVALARERLVLTHSPMDGDPVGRAFADAATRTRIDQLALRAGQVLVVDNHRMLHGRRAFHDAGRSLVRLLVWLPPWRAAPEALASRARRFPSGLARAADGAPLDLGGSAGALVAAMLAGAGPGPLAERNHVPEVLLYRLRDALAPYGHGSRVKDALAVSC